MIIRTEARYQETVQVARKPYPCDDYPGCSTGIQPGEQYLRCTEFPGHDAGYASQAGKPLHLRLCERSDSFQRRVTS